MQSLNLKIDEQSCCSCGECVKDCLEQVLTLGPDGIPEIVPERFSLCIACQHCLAVCPTGALSVFDLDPQNSLTLEADSFPAYQSFRTLVRGRRSCRQFQDKNVPKDLMDRLLDDLAHVPTGCNARGLEFVVIDDLEAMETLRQLVFAKVAKAASGPQKLNDQALAFLKSAVLEYQSGGRDVIFRRSPHLLVVTAPPSHPCASHDVALALAYFELLAVSAGLGVCWCGFLEMLDKCIPDVRPLLGIDRQKAMYAIMYGWPSVQYARTVQRSGSAKVLRVTKSELTNNCPGEVNWGELDN